MKKFLLFIPLAICIGITLFCFETRKAILEDGLGALEREDYERVENSIARLKKKKPLTPPSLQEGYLHLAKREYQASVFKMQQSLGELPQSVSPRIVAEIFLSQAASSSLEGRIEEVKPLVNMAEKSYKAHPLIPFFTNLCNYFEGNFQLAADGFDNYQFPPVDEDKCCWLSPILSKLFSRRWLEMHRAHALCECNEFETAKEILEKELFLLPLQDKQIETIGNLFLGLAYLKEGSHLEAYQKAPYFRMAVLTFGGLSKKEVTSLREKKIITENLKKEIISLLPSLIQYKKIEESLFCAIKILEEWDESEAIEEIAVAMGDFLIGGLDILENELFIFCNAVKTNFNGNGFHSLLMEHCFRHFSFYLKERDATGLIPMWRLVEALAVTPHCYNSRLANLAISEIYRTIILDDESLAKTQMSISFYQQIKNDPEDNIDLAKKLLFYSKILWQREGQEEKGTRLMNIALAISPTQESLGLRKEIETFLTELYFLAEKANTVRRLTLLHDAFAHFQIGRKNTASPAKIANHLADGYYLLSANQYFSAQLNAELVLKLDPDNQQAFKLLGLASFYQGEYQKALCTLKKIHSPDTSTLKALVLSEVFENQEHNDQLAQVALSNKEE